MHTQFTTGDWIRTCQECGHKQKALRPSQGKELPTAYQDAKCRVCKSSGLDYGKPYQSQKPSDDED